MQPWKTRSRRTILECGKFLTVESHTVELPDGRLIEDWAWVVTPDYINVVVVTEDERFLCFRQPKYAANGITLALVGGYIEQGEDPLAAAKRELREETGYEAPDWTPLGDYAVDGNRGAGRGHLFLARGAHPVTAIDADDLEEQEMLLLSRAEIEAALWTGEFKILSWGSAVALALLKLCIG
jgi:8-oxo-dGTP pyrophosphatase MutT (NUDIX family)